MKLEKNENNKGKNMKDENGAVRIHATQTLSNLEKDIAKADLSEYAKEKAGVRFGRETVKNFEFKTFTPVNVDGEVYELDLVVMTPKDYENLADKAWRYDGLK